MNLRAGVATPIQNLVILFKDRAEKVTNRILLEKEITQQNANLVAQLQEVFKPIAFKAQLSFNLTIRDEEIEVGTRFSLPRKTNKKGNIGIFRLGIITHPIHIWMASSTDLRNLVKLVETNVRLLSISNLLDRKLNKITFFNPGTVTINLDTRNRYF